MELIERQSILAALEKAIVNTNPDYYQMDTREGYGDWMHSNGFNCAITHAIVTIEQSVKYDAVPVVRCKDCRWRVRNAFCEYHYATTHDDWFCWGGERKKVKNDAIN